MDWRGASQAYIDYKGKLDKSECSNSRGISLLSAAGRLYGRVLIKKIELELNVQ